MHLGRLKTVSLSMAVLLFALVVGWSCDTDPVGIDPANKRPVVSIVNIPPDNSHFTANPQIYWYGTDEDGYIVSYEYLVIREDTLDNHGVGIGDVQAMFNYASQSESDWTVVLVSQTEGNPTRQTVRLYAGQDPSDTVAQVFFVRAVDDDSARSDLDYRIYSRNNNPPDTKVKIGSSSEVLWDLPDTMGYYKGIEISWEGSDEIDYPSETSKPTFEYYFQLFGPFSDLDTANLAETFDTTQSSKLIYTARDTSTNSVWLKTDRTKVFDLWRNEPPMNETRDAWFVAKATARDDAFVSDPTPAYSAFKAIYPKFENDLAIMLVLKCAPSRQVGNLTCPDQDGIEHPGEDRIAAYMQWILDVFAGAGYPNPDTLSRFVPERRLLGSYKNVVLFSDGVGQAQVTTDHFEVLSEFMDLGGNVWIWAPSPFNQLWNSTEEELVGFSANDVPVEYFDVQKQYNANWVTSLVRTVSGVGVSNEQFVRGLAIYGKGFNDFDIDLTRSWIYEKVDIPVELRGAPISSYFVRDVFSEPIYLIDSYYGDFVPDSLKEYVQTLQGRVCALRYDAKTFKSAVFGFSFWMMYYDDAVEVVQKMMDWFME